jgi:predicted TIM-barrel fold metal-dependent hydrolase
MAVPVIDGHAHVFRPCSERYPRPVDRLAPAEREAPVEEFLRAMDAAGVERAVLVPLGPEDDYLVECLQRHPGRFQGIGVFDPTRPDPAALEARIERTGIRGLRLHGLDAGASDDVRRLPVFPALRTMAEALYEAYGAQRLFWASDYPWIAQDPGYAAMVKLPNDLLPELGPEEQNAIMGGTIACLLW